MKRILLISLFSVISIFVYSQQRLPINAAITQSWTYIENQLPQGARVLINPLNTNYGNLAGYIVDEITSRCINSRKLTILERNNEIIRIIDQETRYQYSGNISDETMISIGHRLGTEYIISVYIQNIGDRYILNIRITDIERGELRGQNNIILEQNPELLSFISRQNQTAPNRIININDSRKIFVFGYEIIETNSRWFLNRTNTTRNEFRNIIINHNLLETRVAFPDLFSSIELINLDDAIDYVLSNKNMFPVQYVLLYMSKTNIVRANQRFNIPDRLEASCDFVLIDFFTNQIHYSNTIDTVGFLFELVDLSENTIINESTKAFRFLFNRNNNLNIFMEFNRIMNGR